MEEDEVKNLLFSAIIHHNDSLLNDLLEGEKGKKLLDLPGQDGNTLLHSAVIENDIECVHCLLRHNANPNVFDTYLTKTPLHLAIELNNEDIVQTFLELEHIDLDIRDDRNLLAHEIAQLCDNRKLADLLLSRREEMLDSKHAFYSLINQACNNNQVNLIRELLEKQEQRLLSKLPHGWSPHTSGKLAVKTSLKQLINWTTTSWNDVTLLFKCASKGYTDICKLLIEYGASAKSNETTNHTPLYVAAYGGHTDTVKLLLDNFPFLVGEITIEKWTVLHACCLQGHSETARLLLNYPYPGDLTRSYITRSRKYLYKFPFDLNAQDAAGQTAIYLACLANDVQLMNTLLSFRITAEPIDDVAESGRSSNKARNSTKVDDTGKDPGHSRMKHNYGQQIQNEIGSVAQQMDRLGIKNRKYSASGHVGEPKLDELSGNDSNICPFELDIYCDYNSKTALHLAVCQQNHAIVEILLEHGANLNAPILPRDSVKSESFSNSNLDTGLNWLRVVKTTCLKEACRLNDETMCDILIRYGANDNQDDIALQTAVMNKNQNLISKFLSLKSDVDPEYKINMKSNVEFASRYRQAPKLSKSSRGESTTFSSMFPSTPVMIDWQNLSCIKYIDPKWLIDASLAHNKRLHHPTTSLIAITRLDLSSNNLKCLPPVIFRLPSLRELNLSKNRLESLVDVSQTGNVETDVTVTTSKLIESHKTAIKRSKSSHISSIIALESSNIIDLNEPQDWDLPCLEVLDLHDNRLISLPDQLFELPKLSELDVSSNQIRQLPWSMWVAPALKEIIAYGNLLDDLPRVPPQSKYAKSNQFVNSIENNRLEDCKSPSGEQTSLNSNLSNSSERRESLTDTESHKDNSCYFLTDLPSSRQIHLLKSTENFDHLSHWRRRVELVSDLIISSSIGASGHSDNEAENTCQRNVSKLSYLNLSYNSFANIPPVLACFATELVRLNMSFNRITSLGDIGLYPAKLKNLYLSNNQLSSWFTTSEVDSSDEKHCYVSINDHRRSSPSVAVRDISIYCRHKLHNRLEFLRNANFSHNLLKSIQIFNDDPNKSVSSSSQAGPQDNNSKRDLLLPNINTLDLSFNHIHIVPKEISALKDLSILNLSYNTSISTLPSELGLLSRLWNLGVTGCSLNEPLKSIISSNNYKAMDVIGYLRSILVEAKPYARMKLMLVGRQGIGKTTLLEQMRHEVGSTGSRKKAPEHWTKRMGHSSKTNLRNQKGITLSTVGVDIHDWIYCKRAKDERNFGPVSFSTWDFGGQQEFYATHRYFLSRRSIYLVVWRLIDKMEGILDIQQWLVNIQSRAPGSPVIIVGTHEDLMSGDQETILMLQNEIKNRFIDIADHDKCGLPRVMDTIVVSTLTKLNIKQLCNRIYDIVFSLRSPGSKERLLEQRIPATYLYLEEIINWIVNDRYQKKREPVLTYEEYRKITSELLKTRYNRTFRDLEPINSREINYNSELQQATRFLHENGVLLHYEDANLRDLYFLDPQWLCDILSHVVTIREINPHIKNGLMKIDDLAFLFKSLDFNLNGGIQSYIVNLLNKFEVALTWNSQYLMIPSLLPADPESLSDQEFQVRMPPRARGRSTVRKYEQSRTATRSMSIGPNRGRVANEKDNTQIPTRLEVDDQPDKCLTRIVLLRYLPAGFLARLQSGILSDPVFDDICSQLYNSFLNESGEVGIIETLGGHAGWVCWQGGIQLKLQGDSTINSKSQSAIQAPILTIKEYKTATDNSLLYRCKLKVDSAQFQSKSESGLSHTAPHGASKWCNLKTEDYSSMIIITVPNWRLKIIDSLGRVTFLEQNNQAVARLVANSIDYIDNLLEDWYPSLGTRFMHTLGGNYLVTRIVPCMRCLSSARNSQQRRSRLDKRVSRSQQISKRINFSISSASVSEKNSIGELPQTTSDDECPLVHCFYVEHCILNAYNISSTNYMSSVPNFSPKKSSSRGALHCPSHGQISLEAIAPDVVFKDILDCYKITNDQVDRCKLIGRGTFGFVFRGTIKNRNFRSPSNGNLDHEVALKLLQPVFPGVDADSADVAAFESAKSNWEREPIQCACKSYCTARHEVDILLSLNHPQIVEFIGLCIRPLAIVLELAPLGCLVDIFRSYQRASMRIDERSAQKAILQVAKALEFLHQQRVIYRDLKAENVLVWSFPSPFATRPENASVELKLADYGVSRQALSTGIWKGFAGTINFLAPEIVRHNGDEEYTEKVDCFSFGMFMYELLTLRPPYESKKGKKCHWADGERPTIAQRDLIYPNHMLDLMSICWSQEPHQRPTASQIVSIVSAPEFTCLIDAVALGETGSQYLDTSLAMHHAEPDTLDLWLGLDSFGFQILNAQNGRWSKCSKVSLSKDSGGMDLEGSRITSICVIDEKGFLWLSDSKLNIHVVANRTPQFRGHKEIQSSRSNCELVCTECAPLVALKKYFENDDHVFIKQMHYVKSSHCVLLLLSTKQLWLVRADTMACEELDDGSIPFGSIAIQEDLSTSMYSPAGPKLTKTVEEKKFRVFCGQPSGISCIEVADYRIHRQNILPLASKAIDMAGERVLDSDQPIEVTSILASTSSLWTAAGCTIHLWSIKDKRVARKLDCSKLVPCSESLESINIEAYYEESRSSVVSSMIRLENQLFIGTSHGCFMIVEADSLKPIIVFRPYEGNTRILLPIQIKSDDNIEVEEKNRYLVTIGTKYRDLMHRYLSSVDDHSEKSPSCDNVAVVWSAKY